mgnify:CR=1 FL=1
MGKQLTAGDICKRKVSVGYKQTSVVAAAQLMREDHVGSLVVVDDENGSRQVRGLVTDRDIVLRAVAENADFVLGIKVRMSENVVAQHGLVPLQRALAALNQAGTQGKLMVHIGGVQTGEPTSALADRCTDSLDDYWCAHSGLLSL